MAFSDSHDNSYVAELIQIGQERTPFLTIMGDISGGGQSTDSFQFPMTSPWELGSGVQPSITETESVAGQTATRFDRTQNYNTCEIHQFAVQTSYKRKSTMGQLTGINLANRRANVQDETAFQIMAHLKQMSKNVEYSMLNGTRVYATDNTTAATMGGITSFVPAANTVDASTADISKALVDQLVRQMADEGSAFNTPILFCSMLQKQRISEIYGYVPEHRNVGGLNIQYLETDAVSFGIVWCPQLVASTILLADMAQCSPVFCPVPGKGHLFYEEKTQAGASEGGMLYGQIGLSVGDVTDHGKIINVSTS